MLRSLELIIQLSGGIDLYGRGFFICIKNSITATELWVDNDYEILAVEVIGKDPKYKREIIGIYRAPNEDKREIEMLLGNISPTRNLTRRSIIEGDLRLPHAAWSRDAGKEGGVQVLVNNLIWDNGYNQVVCKPTRGASEHSQTGECAHLVQRIARNQGS